MEEITAAGYNMPCLFSPPGPASKLVAFHKDKEVTEDVTLLAGEDLVFRCSDVGKYRLEGSQRRRCVGGT